MQALQYRKSVPRYLAVRAFSRRLPALCTSALGCLHLLGVEEPALPNDRWLRVTPILSGICGSDLATIRADGSPYFSPLTSTPFVLGHEVIGIVKTDGHAKLPPGARVVLEPALGCEVRGIAPRCARCAEGNYGNCENIMQGDISAGVQTGYCRDTGGGWSHGFVAHESQLYRVPDEVSDEEGVLAEPLSCALHAVLSVQPLSRSATQQTILVIGCGTMGLLTIAALRAIGNPNRLVAVAKHQHQMTMALKLGASEIIQLDHQFRERLADTLHAQLHRPELGMPTIIGGADVTFDCVGSSATIDDALRFTRARGEVVLIGMPGIPKGVDWTTIWHNELRVRGSYTYGWENYNGGRRKTFEIALDTLRERGSQLKRLVTHKFSLTEYRPALQTALRTGSAQSVKTVFQIGATNGS